MTKVRRLTPSAASVGLVLVGISSLSVILFLHAMFAGLPWLVGAGVALRSKQLRTSEKITMIIVGVVPILSARTYPSSEDCVTDGITDAAGHILHSTTECTTSSPATLPIAILVIPAIAAIVVHVRVTSRRSTDYRVTPPSAHDRTEAQSVEIVLALSLGVSACLSVVLVSWLFRLVIGTTGGAVWSVATATLAIGAGLSLLLRQLLHAGREGL